jgi:protein required for attachment to host cells
MGKTWVLIADTHRARCFERHVVDHTLNELADFLYPKLNLEREIHGRTGHAGTQFEHLTDTHAKARSSFARQLGAFINKGIAEHRCNALVLIATRPMLSELKPCLSSAAEKILQRCVASDLTHYTGAELTRRVDHALQLPH